MVEISIFRARNTTGLAINDKRITNTKPYGLIQTIQKFQVDEKEIINAIENVKEVKHGQWIDEDEFIDIKVCSVCRNEAYWDTDYGQQLFHFCPNCGARMDGDSE